MSEIPPPPAGDPNVPPTYGAVPPPVPPAPAMYPPGPAAYGAPAPAPAPAAAESNGMAVASLILGILQFFCLPGVGTLLAILFGFLGLSKAKQSGVGRGMSIAGILLGVVGLIGGAILFVSIVVLGATASNNLKNLGGVAPSSSYQLTPGSCAVDSVGTATFEGTIKNTTSSAKNFNIKVEFRNKGNNAVLDTETSLVSDIAPGDTAQWSTTAFSSATNVSSVGCKVLEVDNFLN